MKSDQATESPVISASIHNVIASNSEKVCNCGGPHPPCHESEAAVWYPGSSALRPGHRSSIIELINGGAKPSAPNLSPEDKKSQHVAWESMSERRKRFRCIYANESTSRTYVWSPTIYLEDKEPIIQKSESESVFGRAKKVGRGMERSPFSRLSIGPVGQARIDRIFSAAIVCLLGGATLSLVVVSTFLICDVKERNRKEDESK